MYSGAPAECEFGECALYLGQVTWRVFASSKTGKVFISVCQKMLVNKVYNASETPNLEK